MDPGATGGLTRRKCIADAPSIDELLFPDLPDVANALD